MNLAGLRFNDADESRYLAARIPGAELVRLPGDDHAYFVDPEPVVAKVGDLLTGIWDQGDWDLVEPDRVLATVLFTDIVDSTTQMAQLGDSAWPEVLRQGDQHRG